MTGKPPSGWRESSRTNGRICYGPNEELAYAEQLNTLESLQAPPLDITNVRRALDKVRGLAQPGWVAADDEMGLQPTGQEHARIRPTSATLAQALREASEGSETLRALVAAIGRTDGIVYLHDGRCGHQVFACLVLAVTAAGPNRILHIKVDKRKTGIELIASVGHELRHAVEILSDPTIASGVDAYNFYQRVAPTGHNRFETDAAIQAGLDVHAELKASMKRGRAE